jgi:hypothetical protein
MWTTALWQLVLLLAAESSATRDGHLTHFSYPLPSSHILPSSSHHPRFYFHLSLSLSFRCSRLFTFVVSVIGCSACAHLKFIMHNLRFHGSISLHASSPPKVPQHYGGTRAP